MTLEFGTYSASRLITALLREQVYHNLLQPEQQRDLNATYVMDLKSFFYPQEISWQQQVLFRGRQIIAMALTGMLQ